MKKKVCIGVTGASGAPYAKRLLDVLSKRDDVELGVCLSETAPEVWALEIGGDVREHLASLKVPCFALRDYKAPFASGSAGWHAMIVAPCSMGTAARIAHGISDNLLTRAADVMLKEKRALVVVPRETPLSLVHLENLTALARAGATIVPAMPSFYGKPETLADAIDTVVARVLDHVGIANALVKRWGGEMTPLTERALLREGLLDVLEARKSGADLKPFERRLRDADLLALGALADTIRRDEVGGVVRVHLGAAPPGAITSKGLDVLREVAIARVLGDKGARVCVDFGASGLEIAQVALGFGASEISGPIANRRGLPIADDAKKKVKGKGMVALRALQQEEILTIVRRAKREPELHA